MTEDRSDLDDEALLRAHVEGDPEAFAELVQRHRDRLWALALRTTCDADDAADALQEAMISAFRRAEGFRGEAQVTTWLHRIVVNSCLDQLRRRRAKATQSLPADEDRELVMSSVTESDPAEASEQRADVMAALAQLSGDQRAALVLVDMEGYSVHEAADLLGCAAGTVKSRCARGRARLVPLLAQYRRNQQATADVEPLTGSASLPPQSTARDSGVTHGTGGGTP